MNCVIVDDDLFSAKVLSSFIARTSRLVLIETFTTAIDVANFLMHTDLEVDVIFLDIEMPEMSGIDFMKSINTKNIQIVICSSQQKYALESYEYNVCDYLLKPITYARFIKAIGKVSMALQRVQATEEQTAIEEQNTDESEVMYLREGSGQVTKIRKDDIVMLQSMENYVAVTTKQMRITVHDTLKNMLDKIGEKYVIQCQRSFAVGIRYIQRVKGSNIVLGDDKKIADVPIGKSYKERLKILINSFSS
ncbi:MAG: response regulator transcription factor [Bacteroidales bacterium]|nr:response regulator transcription factor [Bacteroidales bacterium]